MNYIDSTPEDTLENRLKRNRDENAGSELISTVLHIEQEKLVEQAGKAKIVMHAENCLEEWNLQRRTDGRFCQWKL